MREIKFRGITKDGTFAYGSLVVTDAFVKHMPKQHSKTWIVTQAFGNGGWFNIRRRYWVDIETVGQYTGLKDKNDKEIYEGDILDFDPNEWGDEGMNEAVFVDGMIGRWDYAGDVNDVDQFRAVIGNIHENPELLGESK